MSVLDIRTSSDKTSIESNRDYLGIYVTGKVQEAKFIKQN